MSPQRRSLIISAFIILASGGLGWAGLAFLGSKIIAEKDNIVQYRTTLASQIDIVSVLAKLKHNAAVADGYQASLIRLLPTQDQLIGFSPWINEIAKETQVLAAASFDTGGITPGGTVGVMNFSMTVGGSMDHIAAFLRGMEERPGFIAKISSFRLVNDGTGNYQFAAQGQLYYILSG